MYRARWHDQKKIGALQSKCAPKQTACAKCGYALQKLKPDRNRGQVDLQQAPLQDSQLAENLEARLPEDCQ